LGNIEILARQWRNDHAQCLGQYDTAQDGAAPKAERTSGLPLAKRHSLDTGSHDLGDVGGSINYEPKQQREIFGTYRGAALEIEAAQRRNIELKRCPEKSPY